MPQMYLQTHLQNRMVYFLAAAAYFPVKMCYKKRSQQTMNWHPGFNRSKALNRTGEKYY
jgi:hypothetical protein